MLGEEDRNIRNLRWMIPPARDKNSACENNLQPLISPANTVPGRTTYTPKMHPLRGYVNIHVLPLHRQNSVVKLDGEIVTMYTDPGAPLPRTGIIYQCIGVSRYISHGMVHDTQCPYRDTLQYTTEVDRAVVVSSL